MPIEQLMALYGYGDRERGGVVIEKASTGGEGEGAEEEEMEEDDEEEDDDTMSSSSSSLALATDGQPVAPTSSESALLPVSNSEEPAAVAPPKSAEKKPRSELHLLYSNDVPEARLLRSAAGIAGATASDEEGEEEEDGDYLPGEDEWRKVYIIYWIILQLYSSFIFFFCVCYLHSDNHDRFRVSSERALWSKPLREYSNRALRERGQVTLDTLDSVRQCDRRLPATLCPTPARAAT